MLNTSVLLRKRSFSAIVCQSHLPSQINLPLKHFRSRSRFVEASIARKDARLRNELDRSVFGSTSVVAVAVQHTASQLVLRLHRVRYIIRGNQYSLVGQCVPSSGISHYGLSEI